MKKQYTFLLAMLLGLLGFSASALSATFKVDGEGTATIQSVAGSALGTATQDTPAVITIPSSPTMTHVYASEGYKITKVDDGYGTPFQDKGDYWEVEVYNDDTMILTMVKSEGGGGDEPVTPQNQVSFTLLTEGGAAKIYKHDASNPEFLADLTPNVTASFDLLQGKSYAVVAGDGLTFEQVLDQGNKDKWVNDPHTPYSGYYVLIDGWQKGEVKITTKTAPVIAESYDVTFEILGGGSTLEIKTYEWSGSGGYIPFATVANGETVTLPRDNTYYVFAGDGYELANVVNAEGGTEFITKWSEPYYFWVGTSEPPSSKYIVTVESKAAPTGTNLFVTEGSKASLYDYNTKTFQDLNEGDNLIVLDANKFYYVTGQEGHTVKSVVKPNGTEFTIYKADSWIPRDYAGYLDSKADKYVITTEPTAAPEPTVFTLTQGSKAGLYTWENNQGVLVQELQEGDNSIMLESKNYYIVALAGYELTLIECDNDPTKTLTINTTSAAGFPGNWAAVDASYKSFTITTKSLTPAATVNFYLATEGTVTVKRYENREFTQTYTLQQGDNELPDITTGSYLVVADDLISVVDEAGTAAEVGAYDDYYGGKWVMLYPTLSPKYTISCGVDPGMSTKIILTAGSKAKGYYTDMTSYEKVEMVFNEGENDVNVPTGTTDYFILALEGNELVSCIYDGDKEVPITTNFYGTKRFKLTPSSFAESYTVTTKVPAKEVKFTVAGGLAEFKKVVNYNYELVSTLNEGETNVEAEDGMYAIFAADGYELVSVKDAADTDLALTEFGDEVKEKICQLFDGLSTAYTVTVKAKETGSDKFIVIVDEVAKVGMSGGATGYQPFDLVDGTNEFDPAKLGSAVKFYSKVGGYLYSVTLDGEALTPDHSGAFVVQNPKGGQVVNVQANYPDVDYTVNLVYPDAQDIWSRVAIRGDYDQTTGDPSYTDLTVTNGSFSAKAGSEIVLWANDPDSWVFESIIAPSGEDLNFFNFPSYGGDPEPNVFFTLTAEGNLTTTAHKMKMVDVTVNLECEPNEVYFQYGKPSDYFLNTLTTELHKGANTITIPEGNVLRVGSTQGYEIESVTYKATADGELKTANEDPYDMTYLAGPFTGNGEMTVKTKAVEPNTMTFTLTVDNPELIKVYTYYTAYNPAACVPLDVTLVAGENTLTIPDNSPNGYVQLWIVGANENSLIGSVQYRYDGKDWSYAPSVTGNDNAYEVWVRNGGEVVVTASEVSYDKSCTVYTDLGNNMTIQLKSNDGRVINLGAGDNVVRFNEDENPFTFVCNSPLKVFVDGVLYEGGSSINLVDGTLVKVFAGSSDLVKVDFVVTAKTVESADFKVVNVMVDGRTEVTDLSKALEVFPGSTITFGIESPEDVTYTVTYQEEELKANAEGVYTIWPREDVNVLIDYTVPVEFALYLKVKNGEEVTEHQFEESEEGWTVSLDELAGSFRIESNDKTVNLGSNGNAVVLDKTYAAQTNGEDMTLECGEATGVKIVVNTTTRKLTVTGTPKNSGITTVNAADLDMNAIYFDLQGRKIAARNVATGIYIMVANGQASKIAVK